MRHDQYVEAAMVVSLIVLGCAVCAVVGLAVGQWPVIDAAFRPAVITGGCTIVAAVGAALVVLWQLRRQAINTIAANKHNEALKLKKEIYDDVRKLCDMTSTSINEVAQFASSFRNEVKRAQSQSLIGELTNGVPAIVSYPHHDIQDFGTKTTQMFNSISDLVRTARSWTELEPRMAHYQNVFLDALHAGKLAVIEFHAESVSHYADRSVKPAHWRAPDGKKMALLDGATERLENYIDGLAENVSAFQSEMQTVLLGDLFNRK